MDTSLSAPKPVPQASRRIDRATGQGAIRLGVVVLITAALLLLAGSASGIEIISQSANTDVVLGLPATSLEFENPLAGTETVYGYKMLEWRDADYAFGPPPWYDDWTVNNPGIDGNPSEIWMRSAGHSISTTTQVAGRIISIHLPGDGNDGIAQVMVDGVEVARLWMNTQGAPDRALIIVKNLANSTHVIDVNDLGADPRRPADDDAHCFGAATLQKIFTTKWEQRPQPAQPDNVFYGWNEFSMHEGPQIAADDWFCTSTDPVTRIRWWGSYLGWRQSVPPAIQPIGFHFAIWTDVPASGQPPFPFSHPGQVIWEYDATTVPVPVFRGWDFDPIQQTYEACFEYVVDLPASAYFYQQPAGNQILWLSVAAVYPAGDVPNPWGWKTRPRDVSSPAPDDAVAIWVPTGAHVGQVFGSGGDLYFPDPEHSFDLAFELISQPTTEQTKWLQPPVINPGNGMFYGWDDQSVRGVQPIVADDWWCLDTAPISRIRWHGSYKNWLGTIAPGNAPLEFHLTIWTDVPMPNPAGYSHPGTCLWHKVIPRTATNEMWVGQDLGPGMIQPESTFAYDVTLPEADWFHQQPGPNGTVYWLCIAARYTTVPPVNRWGWLTRERFWNDDGVRIFSPLAPTVNSVFDNGQPIENPPGVSWDLVFELRGRPTGQPVVKWSQPPASWVPPDAFNGWNEASMFGGPQITADDWVCTTTDPVSDVHWWGSWLGWGERTPPALPDAFHIAIWTDVPVGVEPFSHPGQVLWEYYAATYSWEFVGWDFDPRDPMMPPEACFYFECDIPQAQWFHQEGAQTIYWVSISALYSTQPTEYVYGWKTTPRVDSLAPDDAVAIWDPLMPIPGSVYNGGGPLWWPTPQDSWDTAFILTSKSPEPTDDWGDAPDPPYPTLSANMGAHHTIVPGISLGASIDAEADGQPDPTATGDDLAGLPDEDGVIFNTPLIPGQMAQVTVMVTGPANGLFLSAYIDFNGDGSWLTPGDSLFAVPQPVNGGPVPTPNLLNFLVPPGATPNITTFARFRLHTMPGILPPTGPFQNGEVEDYTVSILQPPEAKWSQQPHPPGEGFDAASDLWWTPTVTPDGKWEQLPDAQFPAIHAHDGPPGTRLIVANDWWCQGGLVTDLHWWGTIEDPVGTGQQLGFHLSVHANDPQSCLPLDPPLWQLDVPIGQVTIFNTGMVNSQGEIIYEYQFLLPEPFFQEAGQRYWFDITSLSVDPANPVRWKWQLGGGPTILCPGADKQEPLPGVWTPLSIGSAEPAFRVTSVNAPPPVNTVVADEFVSDGRPIRTVRWWGSYFDPRYAPGAAVDPLHVLDGWLISFHHQWPRSPCPPERQPNGNDPTVLGVYFAPAAAVQIEPLPNYFDCTGHPVYRYTVDLAACCLICSETDPRNEWRPAEPTQFSELWMTPYWLDVQAVTGALWVPSAIEYCQLQLTGHLPPESGAHFWGWHSSPGPDANGLCSPLQEACVGSIVDITPYPPTCWYYGAWTKQPWLCPTPPQPVHMAFELITNVAAAPMAPWILEGPVDLDVCEDDPATFDVVACGTPPLSYQWRKDGGNIGGATSWSYTIASAQTTDAGGYDVVVTNASGNATSPSGTLTVWPRGTGDADFSGTVDGEDIQWFVGVLFGVDVDPQRYCACDIDQNGTVQPADVDPFVDILLGL